EASQLLGNFGDVRGGRRFRAQGWQRIRPLAGVVEKQEFGGARASDALVHSCRSAWGRQQKLRHSGRVEIGLDTEESSQRLQPRARDDGTLAIPPVIKRMPAEATPTEHQAALLRTRKSKRTPERIDRPHRIP